MIFEHGHCICFKNFIPGLLFLEEMAIRSAVELVDVTKRFGN
jgi:hypothetical protein